MFYLIKKYETRSNISQTTSTHVELWNDLEGSIERHKTSTYHDGGAGGEYDHPTYETETPKEILEKIAEYQYNESVARATEEMNDFNEQITEYNKSNVYQSKGQTVEILEGKNKGFVGIINWEGHDKYANFSSRYNKPNFISDTILKMIESDKIGRNLSEVMVGVKSLTEVQTEGKYKGSPKSVFVNATKVKVTSGFETVPYITLETALERVQSRTKNLRILLGSTY